MMTNAGRIHDAQRPLINEEPFTNSPPPFSLTDTVLEHCEWLMYHTVIASPGTELCQVFSGHQRMIARSDSALPSLEGLPSVLRSG